MRRRYPHPTVCACVAALCLCVTGAFGRTSKTALPRTDRIGEPDLAWVKRTMEGLTLREKVAQLVQVRIYGRFLNRRSEEYKRLEEQIRVQKVGGVVLFAGNIYESAILINDLQGISKLPLIVSADFERGASFRIADTTSFPWTMAVGATRSEDLARREGAVTGQESRALGVHWVYAPVMDVNNNPDNPVINIRAFGEDPDLVARLGAAFIRGARENGVLTTAKHFPGHGDTATDSHIGLAVIPSDASRLDAVELVPFRSAIEAGVDAIMTAHLAIPKLTGEPDLPATLSPRILTDLLRLKLKFAGLIVTDALEMGGITTRFRTGQAAVLAVQAGTDMLLLPPDPAVAIEEVVRAVERGEIARERIDGSVEKVLKVKSSLGLHKQRLVPLGRIPDVVASPESRELAMTIAERSVTVVRDKDHLLPLKLARGSTLLSLVLAGDAGGSPGSVFQAEMRRRFPSIRTATLDPCIADDAAAAILREAAQSDLIVLSTVLRVVSGSGSVGLTERQRTAVERVLQIGKPVVWLAMGNPYVLRAFPSVRSYVCTFSYADVSQIAAARALAGEINITGRLPVTIPGQAQVGEGVDVPGTSSTKVP